MRLKIVTAVGFLLTILSIGLSFAQGACPQLVEQALQAMGANCEAVGRNNACYGYNLVSAEFSETVGDNFFINPADTASLAIVESIQTAGMNTDLSQWGVAVLNLQANIPNSIPGQSVKFVLMGDVELENAVAPDDGYEQSDGLDVVTTSSVNIRSGAGLSFNVISGLAAGDTVTVDGQSADGEWYRTAVGNRIGWIFGDFLDTSPDLDALPILDGKQRSAMQSFYLRTGFGSPVCEEAPQDTLMIQGPQGIEIDFTVNGADIRIGSTIGIRILPPGDIMEFTVIDGHLIISGGAPDGSDLILTEGYRTTTCLSEPDNLGLDGDSDDRVVACDWEEPERIPDEDLGASFCSLENIPGNILNYSVDVMCPGEEPVVIILEQPEEPTAAPTDDDLNLCAEGNVWDDGRCNSEYWWEAGYYYGLLEAGEIVIDDIPGPYYATPTPAPTSEPKEKKKKAKNCADFDGEGWAIYVIASGEFIEYAYTDPGFPACDFD